MTTTRRSTNTGGASEALAHLLKPGVDVGQDATREYVDLFDGGNRGDLRRDQGMFRFKALSAVYDRAWRPLISRLVFGGRLSFADEQRIVLEELAIPPGSTVIDIGCGTGGYTRRLSEAAAGGTVVGVDASEAMIATALKRGGGPNLTYLRGDACALPFRDASFDAVCSVGVIHMLDEPMSMLDEMVRVLSPGGRLVVVTTYEKANLPRIRGQMTAFGRDALIQGFGERGLVDVRQRVVWRGQFVSGRRPDVSRHAK